MTCDLDESAVEVGRQCWRRANLTDRIEVMIAPALETIAVLASANARFDMVFIDADKMAYDRYYEAALQLVRTGGLIVLDNMLQRGEVVAPGNLDPGTVAMRAVNAMMAPRARQRAVKEMP